MAFGNGFEYDVMYFLPNQHNKPKPESFKKLNHLNFYTLFNFMAG